MDTALGRNYGTGVGGSNGILSIHRNSRDW